MGDALAEFRQQIVDDIDRYRGAEITALNTDPWVAISLLQKSIRRGHASTAQRAARTHIDLRGSAIFRRFMVIASEDIGAGSPAIVAMSVAASTGTAYRRQCGGDLPVALSLARLMASAPKSRSAENLICGALHHPACDQARRTISGSPLPVNLARVMDSTLPLPHRALAAWCASGMPRTWGSSGRDFSLPALLDTYRKLGAPEELIVATDIAAARTREPITLMVPLVWLAVQGGRGSTVSDSPTPPSLVVDGVPMYALDKHTRLGREAIGRFAKTNDAVRACLERHVPQARRRDTALMAAFYADAAPLARKLGWAGAAELEALVTEADLFRSGVPPEGIEPILAAFRANLDSLNEVRREVFLKARSTQLELRLSSEVSA